MAFPWQERKGPAPGESVREAAPGRGPGRWSVVAIAGGLLAVVAVALLASVAGEEVRLEEVEYQRIGRLERGSSTYHCQPAGIHALELAVENRGDSVLDLSRDRWRLVWPQGQINALRTMEASSTQMAPGGEFGVTLYGCAPSDDPQAFIREVWLYDRDPGLSAAEVVGKLKVR